MTKAEQVMEKRAVSAKYILESAKAALVQGKKKFFSKSQTKSQKNKAAKLYKKWADEYVTPRSILLAEKNVVAKERRHIKSQIKAIKKVLTTRKDLVGIA